ncbi:unnamed protein product [Ceutorhynchus assimilis]|uniref:Uncharacterized protein n=1 Tax=Ceutorhynchus assimilis TaxID=467358 RepID=A0A9N9ML57_9CUCU|nr:unnamed protein product [Ceutorhynchus assimilis]
MSDLNGSGAGENPPRNSTDATSQDVVVAPENGACASEATKIAEKETPVAPPVPKKRKTRRGKSKRKAPYQKFGRKNGKIIKPCIVKPEAPHNDNQFLFADHGGLEGLDEKLRNIDQLSTASLTRTRDSSVSVDSDGEEFYSSPDDEGEFLMQDFNDQYRSIQTEQLQTMSKQELINEYLALDNRTSQKNRDLEDTIRQLENELVKQTNEKHSLLEEIDFLKNKIELAAQKQNGHMDSEDSETDSSDSGSSSSSSSSGSSRSVTPEVDHGLTNGHLSPPHEQGVDAV